MSRWFHSGVILLVILVLGCGQKGALYLPAEATEEKKDNSYKNKD